MENYNLNEQQKIIFQKYLDGENIFVTGPGGTGKSFLIRKIAEHAENLGIKYKVCALTGCAAILLKCKATTLHSFACIGLANRSIEEVVRSVVDNKLKTKNWKKLELLIIDEVSMLSLKLLLILDQLGRRIHNKLDEPFGGIQVIFTGDFYQLPPVNTNDEDKEASMFCFEHPLWNKIFPIENQISLKTIFRQNETELLKALSYIRKGKITKSTLALLQSRIKTEEEIKKIKQEKVLTILSPIKKEVESINKISYQDLPSDVETYTYNLKWVDTQKSDTKIIEVKTEEAKIVNAKTNDNKTDKKLDMDNLCDNFEELLKRSPKFTKFEYEFLANNIMAEKEIELRIGTHVMCIANVDLQSHNPIANGSQGIVVGFSEGLPLVKFNTISYPIAVGYFTWKSENNDKIAVAQIPLIYAWAITIHKAQGVTLDNALMNIGSSIFEYGQSYVALSRVRSLEGIYLSNLDYNKINANPKVKKFYGD